MRPPTAADDIGQELGIKRAVLELPSRDYEQFWPFSLDAIPASPMIPHNKD
jgi:hypothetical protein